MASPSPSVRLIWVQRHPDAPKERVAIYDRDPAHPATRGNPAGELYIADDFPRLVAETVAVNQKCQRSQGGPPDLHVLHEDDALKIEKDLETAEEERLNAAREEAMRAQASQAPQMPPEVAAWLANNRMVAMSSGGAGGFQAPPPVAAGASQGRGAGDTRAESTGATEAVESGPGPTPDADEGESASDAAEDQDPKAEEKGSGGRRSPRA